MFIRGLNYIFDSEHILWWSTPLVLVNKILYTFYGVYATCDRHQYVTRTVVTFVP